MIFCERSIAVVFLPHRIRQHCLKVQEYCILCNLLYWSFLRRHVGVIKGLYEGLQCSSCGLRFPGEAATIYREHLDWHFRKNRREKDGKRIAHRQWYFAVKDWLSYEEISDPDERGMLSPSPLFFYCNHNHNKILRSDCHPYRSLFVSDIAEPGDVLKIIPAFSRV